jgi:hypothetical protein
MPLTTADISIQLLLDTTAALKEVSSASMPVPSLP